MADDFRKCLNSVTLRTGTHLLISFGPVHNGSMPQESISLNRAVIGVMSLVCLIAAAALLAVMRIYPDNGGIVYTQGGLARIGLVLGTLWLAMPSHNREAAWANISPKFLALLLGVAIVMIRIPPRILIPAAIVTCVAIVILRPRPKRRPTGGH